MTERRDPEAWKIVYEAKTPAELAAAYADWANFYDRETLGIGYTLPFLVTSWLARHVPTGAGPILDAGCGTGLSGSFVPSWKVSTCRRICWRSQAPVGPIRS